MQYGTAVARTICPSSASTYVTVGSTPAAGKAGHAVHLTPEQRQVRAAAHLVELERIVTTAVDGKVDRLTAKLLKKGVLVVAYDAIGRRIYGLRDARASAYQRLRDWEGKLCRSAEFDLRSRLKRPRMTGAKPFRSGCDKVTLTTNVNSTWPVGWATAGAIRGGINLGTSSGSSAAGLAASGVAGSVVGICCLLDGVDMLNACLDQLAEQDRMSAEIVLFHQDYLAYMSNRKAGRESPPDVTRGFRRFEAAMGRSAVFDKSARGALRRCLAGALRDTGLGSAGALAGAANMALKIHSATHVVSTAFDACGMGLNLLGTLLSWPCIAIDGWVASGEYKSRKQEYRNCKAKCQQIQDLIDRLAPGAAGSTDRDIFLDILKAAQKRHRRLMKQARYEMKFATVRGVKAAANGLLSAPLSTAATVTAIVAATVGTAAAVSAAPVLAGFAGFVGVSVSTGYLASYVVKARTREEMRRTARVKQYDASILVATTPATGRTDSLIARREVNVAGTQGYWTGGRDGFAAGYVHEIKIATHPQAALVAFSDLLARRPPGGHSDVDLEAGIQEFLAISNIDKALFRDIELMVGAQSKQTRAQGMHSRDVEWGELLDRQVQYAPVFGLKPEAPRLPPGALLPSFQAACWSARLSGHANAKARKFGMLLEQHLNDGDQIDLRGVNDWLQQKDHYGISSALKTEEMWSTAERLFHSVPPTLFINQTKALLSQIDVDVGDRKAFGWQDDSPMLRDLRAFCEFTQAQWIPAYQVLSRVCGDSDVGAAKVVRTCTAEELSAARRHLASGGSMPPPRTSMEDRRALKALLYEEWTRRFAADSPGARRRTAAVLAEHCAMHGKFAGRAWSSDSMGGFHCDLGGRKVAVIRAAEWAKWVTRGDWTHPLPIEMRSRTPASAVRWLINEPGAGVDERFLKEAGHAPSLLDIHASFDLSEHNRGKSLRSRLISRDGIASRHGDDAEPSQFTWLEKTIGEACRVALGEASERSTRPWALLEKTVLDGAPRWELKSGDKKQVYPTLEAAVQACCDARGVDAVRAVFLTNPARPRRLLQSGPHSRRAHVQERTPLPHRPMDPTAA